MEDEDLADIIESQAKPPRVISVGQVVESSDGVRTIITSLEVWSWRVVVRFTDCYPPGSREWPPPRPDRDAIARRWTLTDDVATEYRPLGHGAGGDTVWHEGYVRFDGTVPRAATTLILRSPDGVTLPVPLVATL